MLSSLLVLGGGLLLLLWGGYVLLPGTISLAQHLRLPAPLIAIGIIAAGTSMPELLVSVDAALTGTPEIAWGNLLGSNIANLLLVLGLGALIVPIPTKNTLEPRDQLFVLAFTIVATVILFFDLLGGAYRYVTASILMSGFFAYMGLQLWSADRFDASGDTAGTDTDQPLAVWRASLYCIGGVIGLIIGADLFVEGGVSLASALGLSQTVIGLTIIAIGTSLPEIIAVLASILHRRNDIALSNIIGSNIFNLSAILGIAGLTAPLPAPDDILGLTLPILMLSTTLICWISFKGIIITRVWATVFVGFYFLFLISQI
jgi:cation:H+ antiporter